MAMGLRFAARIREKLFSGPGADGGKGEGTKKALGDEGQNVTFRYTDSKAGKEALRTLGER